MSGTRISRSARGNACRRRLWPAALLAACPWLARASGSRPEFMDLAAALWAGFEYPVLNVFLFLAIVTLLTAAVLRRRHRSELLSVCLALSMVLHLLSLSLFSVVPIGSAPKALAPRTGLHRIEIGTPSVREALVSQGLRSAPLETEWVDPQVRLQTDRIARDAPVREGEPVRMPGDLPETPARDAERGEVKTPEAIPQKTSVDESLASLSERPLELAALPLAAPRPERGAADAGPAAPGEPDKSFELTPAERAAAPDETPAAPRAALKDAERDPSGVPLVLADAGDGRQPELGEALERAVAQAAVERVAIAARAAQAERPAAGPAAAEPAGELAAAKAAGGAPDAGGPPAKADIRLDSPPEAAAASLAAGQAGGMARHLAGPEESLADPESARLDPLAVVAGQAAAAGDRPAAAPAARGDDQRSWPAERGAPAESPVLLAAPAAASRTPRTGLQEPSRLPAGVRLDATAVGGRQTEVRDAIQPAAARTGIERLVVPALASDQRRAERAAEAGSGGAAELRVARVSGTAPEASEPKLAAADGPAVQPRMAGSSLAGGSPDGLERKQTEVGWVAVDPAPDAVRIEPVRMSGRQDLLPSARAGSPGRPLSSAPDGVAEWATARETGYAAGASPAVAGKPRAGVMHTASSKAPIRVGLGGDSFLPPKADAPSVRDMVSDMPAGRPGVQAIGDPVPGMALAQGGSGPAGGAAVDRYGLADLPPAARRGGLGTLPVAAGGGVPGRPSGIREGLGDGAAGAESMVEGSGGGVRSRGSASTGVKDQLAGLPAGGVGADLTPLGTPAQLAPGVGRGAAAGSTNEGLGVAMAALAPDRRRADGVPAGIGAGPGVGAGHPAIAGRSDIPAGRESFVGQAIGGGGAARPAGASVAGERQLTLDASASVSAGAAKALVGQVSALSAPGGGGGRGGVGGGYEPGGRGPASVSVGRVGGGVAGGVSGGRAQAPAMAGGGSGAGPGPAGTLVAASALPAAGPGRSAGSGIGGGEGLVAMAAPAGVSDAGGLALLAPTVKARGAQAGGLASAGAAPAGVLRVAKAGGGGETPRDGAGGRDRITAAPGGVIERGPVRMEMSLSEGPPSARVAADISAGPSGQGARRSFLSVASVPKPDFVPDKAIYQMRKPEKRREFIRELGGTAETEQAVEQALDWLGRTQSADGRWDVDGFAGLRACGGAGDLAGEDAAVTGLSLLAYLGAGYTHLEGVHRETVRKGLDWLLGCEQDGDLRGAGQMYSQAIATAALCEAYSLTGDARLREPVQRAVRFIVEAQTPEAGWRYEPRNDSDTSVTGWQILALKSAQIAGLPVPARTIRWTELWLDKVRQGAEGGLYCYKPGHAVTPVMTAEGAFCQLFMAETARARGQAESTAYLMEHLPSWDPKNRTVHLYYWYYGTLTLYLAGAKEFEAWNAALTRALLDGRRKSGPAAGSWDPVCQLGARGGRIYSTAAATLCLEVYYRFLPLYKRQD